MMRWLIELLLITSLERPWLLRLLLQGLLLLADEVFDSSKNNWKVTEEDEKRFKEQEEIWLRYEIEKMTILL